MQKKRFSKGKNKFTAAPQGTSNGRIINFCAVVNKDFVGIYVLNIINQTEILIN